MRFASYCNGDGISYGVVADEGVLDLPTAAYADVPDDLLGLIAAGAQGMAAAQRAAANGGTRVDLSTLALVAPIQRPGKNVFCAGRNYKEHVVEGYRARGAETKLPEYPQFFTKPPTAIIGPNAPFYHDPAVTQRLDYEVELALIIGNAGRDIPRERAMDHVFGFTMLNDITGRDLERRHDQWFKGKGLDRSCPMGPIVVTPDELGDVGALELICRVNGEERQRSTVSQMIFDIPEIIAQLSAGLTLEPGDIIATGTPSGVGYAMDPPRYLVAGDVVECSIAGIGMLRTPIEEPRA
jgi:2-keto-4-pentenoate hydratase/2-oxohepta-3-ene-1,7-dioic acid hydratase in catechol pathway